MAKEPKVGKITRLEFHAAKNGLTSETSTQYDRGGKGGGPSYDTEYETSVHPTMAHAVKHLKASMAHCYGGGQPEPEGEPEA